MIFVTLLEILYTIFNVLLGWINLPCMPDDVNTVYEFVNLAINNGANLVCFFFNVNMLKVCGNLILGYYGFEYIYWIVIWILKKIPGMGIN